MSLFQNLNSHSVVVIKVSGLASKMVSVCREVKVKFMKDAKSDRMSNVTTTGNSGEPWMHLLFT